MGFAKYYEDNLSIYVGRMAMSKPESVINRKEQRAQVIYKKPCLKQVRSSFLLKNVFVNTRIRKGLQLNFQKEPDNKILLRMRLNGWWFSKAHSCWCNLNTTVNLKYAKTLIGLGAQISVTA